MTTSIHKRRILEQLGQRAHAQDDLDRICFYWATPELRRVPYSEAMARQAMQQLADEIARADIELARLRSLEQEAV
jgi:hypothetical protein